MAHQLIKNGQTPEPKEKKQNYQRHNGISILNKPVLIDEIKNSLGDMKMGKAAGIDDLCSEQLKRIDPIATKWISDLFNNCITNFNIPKELRKSRVTAILKPGKNPNDPKSFRPISLLCHCYKLFERVILNRLKSLIEDKLIPRTSWLPTWEILHRATTESHSTY